MFYIDANEVVDELFESLRSRYQGCLETSMRGSDVVFDSVQLKYYKCHKVNFRRGGFPDWIKKKKAIINPKTTNNKCFQYAVTAPLNYEEIKLDSRRISNIKPFVNKYNRKGINYPSEIDDWKTFEKNNSTISLILYTKEKEICPAYISKINSNWEK